MIEIEIARQHDRMPPVDPRWRQAIHRIMESEQVADARVSLAIVDDTTIHDLNRRYLRHDYATDVLSFLLERSEHGLEGEVVVSADTADRVARQAGWSAADELLLYVVHGSLHLVGYDDVQPDCRREMRRREQDHLARFGIEPRILEGTHEADLL